MMPSLLGLTLSDALSVLKEAGQEPGEITVIRAPRGNPPRGTLRVVRVRDGGKELVCGEFPDHVAPQNETTDNLENIEREHA